MDSPNSDDANKQIVLVSPKMEPGSTSGVNQVPVLSAEEELLAQQPPPGFENYQLAIVDHEHDREYGCRYCDKKFSNKQALGGHQNAHKVERSMEIKEHDTSIDFFAGPNPGPNPFPAPMNMPPGPFVNSYPPRPSDFLNRSLFTWSCGGVGAGGIITYNPRAVDHGFNCIYHGWSAPPFPRVPQFVAPHPHYMLPPHNHVNIRLPNFGPGSAGAFRNVLNHQGPAGFARFGVRPGGGNWPAAPVNLRNVPGVSYDEQAGLDLSLKLGD